MRVRVAYTVDVTDEYRRAIRRYYGLPGLATRAEVVDWHVRYGDSMDDDLLSRDGDVAANPNPCLACGMSLMECDNPLRSAATYCCEDCDHGPLEAERV